MTDGRPQLEAAIWEDPNDWASFVALARLHAAAGAPQRARMYLREIVHRVPSDDVAKASIGAVYVALGEGALAAAHLEEAVLAAPRRADIRLLFARALLMAERWEEAEGSLRLAEKLGAPAPKIRRTIERALDPTHDAAAARARLERLQTEGDPRPALPAILARLDD